MKSKIEQEFQSDSMLRVLNAYTLFFIPKQTNLLHFRWVVETFLRHNVFLSDLDLVLFLHRY